MLVIALTAATLAPRGITYGGPGRAIVAGLALGIGEWVAESDLYFGGPLKRLHAASEAPAAASSTF